MNVQAPSHRKKRSNFSNPSVQNSPSPLTRHSASTFFCKYTLRCGMSGKTNRKKRRIFEDDTYKMSSQMSQIHTKSILFCLTLHLVENQCFSFSVYFRYHIHPTIKILAKVSTFERSKKYNNDTLQLRIQSLKLNC